MYESLRFDNEHFLRIGEAWHVYRGGIGECIRILFVQLSASSRRLLKKTFVERRGVLLTLVVCNGLEQTCAYASGIKQNTRLLINGSS